MSDRCPTVLVGVLHCRLTQYFNRQGREPIHLASSYQLERVKTSGTILGLAQGVHAFSNTKAQELHAARYVSLVDRASPHRQVGKYRHLESKLGVQFRDTRAQELLALLQGER